MGIEFYIAVLAFLIAGAWAVWLMRKLIEAKAEIRIRDANLETFKSFALKNEEEAKKNLEATVSSAQKNLHESLQLVKQESEKRLNEERNETEARFKLIAQEVLDASAQKVKTTQEERLGQLLNPLREKIQTFEKRVEESYQTESRERFALKEELHRMFDLNQKMSLETQNLTKALKGDVKVQGAWGEMILERLLEMSGLRKGEEYQTQSSSLSDQSEEARLRPDVVIHLPDQKHLIVDSKVSLKSFERSMSAESDEEKKLHTKAFIQSVNQHIQGLGAKHYSSLSKLNTPDLVLLFMPIEASFSMALQLDTEIFTYAWDRKIVLVSPTTLLATLRTVASLWRSERQNKNALEIARQGGGLYDKFVAFVSDLEAIGRNLDQTHKGYVEAMGKLSNGKGNLVSRVENLKKLGAKTQKSLDRSLFDQDLPEQIGSGSNNESSLESPSENPTD